jgi:hypothetical protein
MKLSRIFLALMIVMACAAAAPDKPWSIEVSTSGGLTGRGIGSWKITSDGTVAVHRMNGTECSFEATDEELRTISRLLAAATPARWRESYVPENTCCDRIEYAMEIEEAGRVSTTRWLDAPPSAPKDLTELANAIVGGEKSLRAVSAERCR